LQENILKKFIDLHKKMNTFLQMSGIIFQIYVEVTVIARKSFEEVY